MDKAKLKYAIEHAYEFCEEQQSLLDKGIITEKRWFENRNLLITNIYLKGDNPRKQSGHTGDEQRYRYTQGMLLEALYKSGSLIDIGCANGYLLEKLNQWIKNLDLRIDFHGLDISKELIALAKERLPSWKDHFYAGNALYWNSTKRFDYICVRELTYVPTNKQRSFFFHLYNDILADNGRLIIGPLSEEAENPILETQFRKWNITFNGYCFKSHQDYKELIRKMYWFDKV
jgi:cyclopropane fatty-acyl-phospholipid synthase-like methyltransferase